MRSLLAVLVVATLPLGCAAREAPYRFRNPLVGGVSAAPIPPFQVATARHRRTAPTHTGRRMRTRPATTEPRRRLPALSSSAPNPLRRRPVGDTVPLAEVLRGTVGQRDTRSSDVAFALRALRAIGATPDSPLAEVRSGPQLVALAAKRKAIDRPGPALLGDILVFDGAVGRNRASLVGVVVSRRSDDTIEFVYLTRGVVRRGFVNPSFPSQKRGPKGHARNTFVRHSNGRDPRGTRYLAGHLLGRIIRLDRLTGR